MRTIKKPQEPKPLGVFYPIARGSHHKEKPTGDTLASKYYLAGLTTSTTTSNSFATCKRSSKTATYSLGEIMDSKTKKSASVGMCSFHLRSPVNRLRNNSIIAACASVGADLKSASAVAKNSRSCSFVVVSIPSCGLSIQPCGSFKRFSICRAIAGPMFLRWCLTCDKYRSDNSTRSANSLSIPLLGRCEFISRNWRNKVVKFLNLISVVSICGTRLLRHPNDDENFSPLLKNCDANATFLGA